MTQQFTRKAADPDSQSKGSGRSIQPVASLLRHWKLALAVAFGVCILGAPVAWTKGKSKFRTEGVLFVSPRFLRNLEADQEHELQSNSQYREFVQQQVKTINRQDIIAAVMVPGTPGAKYWKKSNETERRAAERLRSSLQITPVPDTYQVTVALDGDKPEGLAEVINSVMAHFVSVAHTETLYDSDARLRSLAQEKQHLEEAVAKLQDARTEISRELGTTVFSGSLVNSFDRELGSSNEALVEARRQRLLAEAAANPKSSGTDAAALQNALSDPSLNTFKGALSQRKAELLISISGLSPQHTARIAAEKEIAAIDQRLDSLTGSLKNRLAGNLDTINRARVEQTATVERQLSEESKTVREKIEAYSRGYQRSLELGDELDRTRKRLNATEDRISFLQLETHAPGFVRVFSPAVTPDLPFEGGRKKLFMMVLAAALVFSLAVPLGIDYMDPRLKAPAELESHLGLPITGWLPLADTLDSDSLMRAAVSIRRNIETLRYRTIVVTALRHGAGSSTVCLGLGATLNRLGLKTLVVEANPLTPDARYAGNAEGGLIEWLDDSTSDMPVLALNGTLPDRIATGSGSPDQLLPVERLIPLFEQEAHGWDLILIDAAPLELSLATEELIRVFGSALLVVDAQNDNKQTVTNVLNKIERLAPETFGALLNKVGEARSGRRAKKNDPAVGLAA